MRILNIFLALAVVLSSWFVGGQDQKTDLFLVCSRQKETRWLRAFKLENGRCKTLYSKEGYQQVISAASYFASCEAVMNTVKKNIEEGGFKCKEQSLMGMVEVE